MPETADSGFFRVDRQDDLAAVTVVRNRITDEDNVEQFGQSLIDLVETGGVRRLLVDASDLSYVTSSVLGKLIHVHRRMSREGGRMVICSVRPELMEILEATRLTTLFELAQDPAAGRFALANS